MKAMVLNKPAPVESKPLEIEDSCDDEIRYMWSLQNRYSHKGEIMPLYYPIIPGHEVVGRMIVKG